MPNLTIAEQFQVLERMVATPFDDAHIGFYSVLIILNFFTIFASALVIYVTFKHKSLRTSSNILVANLSLADSILSLVNVVLAIGGISQRHWYGGPGTCLANASLNIVLCGVFTQTLALIAFERYQSVVKARDVSKQQAILMLAASWGFCIFVACVPYIGGQFVYYGLKPSGLYCCAYWQDYFASSIVTTLTCLSIVSSALLFTAYFYYEIIKVTLPPNQRSNKAMIQYVHNLLLGRANQTGLDASRMSQHGNTDGHNDVIGPSLHMKSNHEDNDPLAAMRASLSRRRLQLVLIRKALLIVNTFLVAWTPFFASTLYEFFARQPVSRQLDTLMAFFVIINGAVNPVLNVVLDTRYKRAVTQLLWPTAFEEKENVSQVPAIPPSTRHTSVKQNHLISEHSTLNNANKF